MNALNVKTASGRAYQIDLAERRFRTVGDQEFQEIFFGAVVATSDPHHEWTPFASLQVDEFGRLYIVEPGGAWRQSTRVVEGLVALVEALDAPEGASA